MDFLFDTLIQFTGYSKKYKCNFLILRWFSTQSFIFLNKSIMRMKDLDIEKYTMILVFFTNQ